METKLITKSDISNPIAKNISKPDVEGLINTAKDILNQPAGEPYESNKGAIEAAVKYFIGASPLLDPPEIKEPEFGRYYLLNFFIDDLLHSSFIMLFLGMTEGLRWYTFEYVQGTDIQPGSNHLLNAAESAFPNYSANPYPGVTIKEQYLLIP